MYTFFLHYSVASQYWRQNPETPDLANHKRHLYNYMLLYHWSKTHLSYHYSPSYFQPTTEEMVTHYFDTDDRSILLLHLLHFHNIQSESYAFLPSVLWL